MLPEPTTDTPPPPSSVRRGVARGFVVILALAGCGLAVLTFWPRTLAPGDFSPFLQAGTLVTLAFFCEYVDSSLGMGYGTLLTPLLTLLGFDLESVVVAILLSEALTGLAAGVFHHRHGNVDWRRDVDARRTLASLAVCSLAGAVFAVAFAVSLSKKTVNLYVALMIIGIAAYLGWRAGHPGGRFGDNGPDAPAAPRPNPARIVILGLIAAFNKGVSGGGYGPLLTGGQVLSGVPERTAVAVTSLAESGVCVLGFALYVVARGAPDWKVAAPLCVGALLSVPLATWTVKALPVAFLRRAMVGAMLYLGLLMLAKLFLA